MSRVDLWSKVYLTLKNTASVIDSIIDNCTVK